ncbi:MAG: RNA polymerase sigma factor [Candidatus Staskawiczbacteria bacterium]|nr:RNA polymerase sigma factor [Candidatus Staskawiczbacteria bacterium]
MNGVSEQFSQIYDQYIEKIYRFVYLKVSSQETAEDITSKVFLRGWEVYQKDQANIKNMNAFLYQIARNAVTDHYRENAKTKTVSQDAIPEVVDAKANIYEKAVLSSDIDAVKVSIQSLKKEYQDVIIWHYLEDMHPEQIAEILDKPAGTIRVMIHRGLKALRDQISNEA